MITFQELTENDHEEIIKPLIKTNFSYAFPHFDPNLVYDEATLELIEQRRSTGTKTDPWTGVVCKENDHIIGWSLGKTHRTPNTYIMANSFVLPEYRRNGLYTKLLQEVVLRQREQNYKRIVSRHLAANNPILIAKLRFGFAISGVQVFDDVGIIVNLLLNLEHSQTPAIPKAEIFY